MLASSFNVLRNILSAEPPPSKVIEVKLDQYLSRHIQFREDGLILYAPAKDAKKDKSKFEIVLHRPCSESMHQAFSLYRSEKLDDAEQRFMCLHDKLPVFIEISKEMCYLKGLQMICDVLIEHPTWSLAHLAAHFGLYDAFNHATVNRFLNSSDPGSGMSPLQVAVTTQNLKTIQLLVASKCSLEHLDNNSNSVFHYAASTTKDIISALSHDSPRCLNYRNKNGQTPLHMACLANNTNCVKALLLAGADVNISASHVSNVEVDNAPGYVGNFLQDNPNKLYAQDFKFGGTPLHWSCSREVIETLIDMGCNLNALNFDSRTALHVMVLRNRLECVVALLSREADPNIADNEGNTALHSAVKENNIPIVQSLVVFGANIDYTNNHGQSPRHLVTNIPGTNGEKLLYILHAVGALRCGEDVIGCTEGCKASGDFNGKPPPVPLMQENRAILNQMLDVAGLDIATQSTTPRKRIGGRLLCLDGGGIRGLILIQMLLSLESVLKCPIVHCFDWIAGTSTGGILALGLATGKTLRELLCLYFRMKEYAFVGGRPYASEALETILKEALGTETTMANITNPKIMITGVLADRKPVDLHLFRNYVSPSQILDVTQMGIFEPTLPPEKQLIWQAARATGAAPSYFRAYGRFLDGGLIANNPTLDALTEIQEYNLALNAVGRGDETTPVSAVVSLGTGLVPVTQLKAIDVFRPDSIIDTARLAIGMSALGNLLVDQATCSDGRVVDRARAWCSMTGIPYYRFSPQMSEDITMDERSDEKLVNMLWEAKAYMQSNISLINKMVVNLANESI